MGLFVSLRSAILGLSFLSFSLASLLALKEMVVVQFMSYVRSEQFMKTRSLGHIMHNVVSSLVTVCPCQQFVLANCHATRLRVSSKRLEKSGVEPTTPGLEGEKLNHYTTEASLEEMCLVLYKPRSINRIQNHFNQYFSSKYVRGFLVKFDLKSGPNWCHDINRLPNLLIN